MKEYKLLENFTSIPQNVERLNQMSHEGWVVHTFTDLLTLLERTVSDDTEVELLLG